MKRVLWLILFLALPVRAADWQSLPAQGELLLAFQPGDDGGALIESQIRSARRQVLVQAFSFTHERIANALIEAHERGVDVRVLLDREQYLKQRNDQGRRLRRAGVPLWLDGEHQAAHNKVMIIDAMLPTATVITGSFNFTHGAQFNNAENVLVLRGHAALARLFVENWQQHRLHSIEK
jgi:phosphatidylserine/phosphatidylglycerophosphate/cardiolipin synthase-like enzyme